MKTLINKYSQNGEILKSVIYTCGTKQSLINFIMQDLEHNYNTQEYPKHIEGIMESKKKNCFYYETKDFIIQALQQV